MTPLPPEQPNSEAPDISPTTRKDRPADDRPPAPSRHVDGLRGDLVMARMDWVGARQRDRMRRPEAHPEQPVGHAEFPAKFLGRCEKCHAQIKPRDVIRRYLAGYRHAVCPRGTP